MSKFFQIIKKHPVTTFFAFVFLVLSVAASCVVLGAYNAPVPKSVRVPIFLPHESMIGEATDVSMTQTNARTVSLEEWKTMYANRTSTTAPLALLSVRWESPQKMIHTADIALVFVAGDGSQVTTSQAIRNPFLKESGTWKFSAVIEKGSDQTGTVVFSPVFDEVSFLLRVCLFLIPFYFFVQILRNLYHDLTCPIHREADPAPAT